MQNRFIDFDYPLEMNNDFLDVSSPTEENILAMSYDDLFPIVQFNQNEFNDNNDGYSNNEDSTLDFQFPSLSQLEPEKLNSTSGSTSESSSNAFKHIENTLVPQQTLEKKTRRRGRPIKNEILTIKEKTNSPIIKKIRGLKRPETKISKLEKVFKLTSDRLPSSLSSKELHLISSIEYEKYLLNIVHNLSKSELDISKHQKRKIKNRESASNSRIRKQDNIIDLMNELNLLKKENENLKTSLLAKKEHNSVITNELNYHKSLIQKHFPEYFSPLKSIINLLPTSNQDLLSPKSNVRSIKGHDQSTAGLVCLVLFALAWKVSESNKKSFIVPASAIKNANIFEGETIISELISPLENSFLSQIDNHFSNKNTSNTLSINQQENFDLCVPEFPPFYLSIFVRPLNENLQTKSTYYIVQLNIQIKN